MLKGPARRRRVPIVRMVRHGGVLTLLTLRLGRVGAGPHVVGGQQQARRREDVGVLGLRGEAPFAAVHPVHLVGPEIAAAGLLLPAGALGAAELLDEARLVGRGDARPGLTVEDAAVFADDELGGAVGEDVAFFAGEFVEFGGDAGDDLLRALRFVGDGEGVVFVRVDDGGVPGGGVGRPVFTVGVVQCGVEVPCVADVDGDAGIHLCDGADDAVVPLVHARRSGGSFVTQLYAYHAVQASSYFLG